MGGKTGGTDQKALIPARADVYQKLLDTIALHLKAHGYDFLP